MAFINFKLCRNPWSELFFSNMNKLFVKLRFIKKFFFCSTFYKIDLNIWLKISNVSLNAPQKWVPPFHHFKVAEYFSSLSFYTQWVFFYVFQIFAQWLKMFTVHIFVHEDIICYFYAKSRSCREKIFLFLYIFT